MASDSAQCTGIMTWVSGIRTTMTNDPGRQLLEDQIQTSGFLFLEDYLDSILARPKHNPIIELVKTPGRKKDASRKTRAFTAAKSKAKATILVDLNDDDCDKENEIPATNSAPINAFHKALLQSRDASSTKVKDHKDSGGKTPARGSHLTKPISSRGTAYNGAEVVFSAESVPEEVPTDEDEREVEEKIVEKLVTPPHLRVLSAQDHAFDPPEPVTVPNRMNAVREPMQIEPTIELSVIEEDVESARRDLHPMAEPSGVISVSHKQLKRGATSSRPYPKKSTPVIDMMSVMDIDETTNFTITSTSTQSFRTVPLDSPVLAIQRTETSSNDGVGPQPQSTDTRPSTPQDATYTTAPLTTEDKAEANTTENIVNIGVPQKPNVSEFPTIGPPSPLRKSMRGLREPKAATTQTRPAAKPTRSSWLVKAREAKAQEDNVTKLISTPNHHVATGTKRKSGDMHGARQGTSQEHDEPGRTQKLTKVTSTSPVFSMLKEQDKHPFGRYRDELTNVMGEDMDEDESPADGSDVMINKLRKAVAGHSARAGKSMGKSLGGVVATGLAEARAAAEAKIAERNAAEGRIVLALNISSTHEQDANKVAPTTPAATPSLQSLEACEKNRRLSVSDLVLKYDASKSKEPERVFQPPPPSSGNSGSTRAMSDGNAGANTSTSTTPPNSPPKLRPPIFTLPEKPKLPLLPTFFPPPHSQTFSRLEPQPIAPPRAPQALSAHSTLLSAHSTLLSAQSTYPEVIFDNEIPAWVPCTQDTDLSDHALSQNGIAKSNNRDITGPETDMDADESWHLDDKFGETWTPVIVGMKDDSMTWSTAPTRSTRSADTGVLDASVPPLVQPDIAQEQPDANDADFQAIPSDNPPCTASDDDDEEDMDVEFDENIASVRLVTPAAHTSILSTQSSRLQVQEDSQTSSSNAGGFFSSASKLMSSVLGGSKKGKEPVKSLQLAAVVAKKQQEEAERKVNRLKDMELRRQQVLQKRADEDKAREERKTKEDAQRWKREREKEDTTEKRALRQPGKKLTQLEEDLAKRRKFAEGERKIDSKKTPSKDMPGPKMSKYIPSGAQAGINASAIPMKTSKHVTVTATQNSSVKVAHDSRSVAKSMMNKKEMDKVSKQSSQEVQTQMQARYQAQFDDSRKADKPPPVSTEAIELPDINSEYSDSDDENRVRTFDPPNWAQSPELREALQSQSTVNPDDIFGAIRPLKMEELFKNRTSRFRARTSSANWAGTDELTAHEEREYAKRMGYRR